MTEHCDESYPTSVVNNMPREAVRELLELAEKAPITINNKAKNLTISLILDTFDNEFLLEEEQLSGVEVCLDGRRGFATVQIDEPERSLAQACAKVLLVSNNRPLKIQAERLLRREWNELREQRKQLQACRH